MHPAVKALLVLVPHPPGRIHYSLYRPPYLRILVDHRRRARKSCCPATPLFRFEGFQHFPPSQLPSTNSIHSPNHPFSETFINHQQSCPLVTSMFPGRDQCLMPATSLQRRSKVWTRAMEGQCLTPMPFHHSINPIDSRCLCG